MSKDFWHAGYAKSQIRIWLDSVCICSDTILSPFPFFGKEKIKGNMAGDDTCLCGNFFAHQSLYLPSAPAFARAASAGRPPYQGREGLGCFLAHRVVLWYTTTRRYENFLWICASHETKYRDRVSFLIIFDMPCQQWFVIHQLCPRFWYQHGYSSFRHDEGGQT